MKDVELDGGYVKSVEDVLAERKLFYFLKQAWPIVEPSVNFKNNWHIGCICEHLEAIKIGQIRNLVVSEPPRHMKLCADSTPIATPDGYKTHGEIRPGDRVFGPDGKPVAVLRISEKGVADHEVSFSNGETVKCNGDHLWTVYDRFKKKWRTLRTDEIMNAAKPKGRSRFFIPDSGPLQFGPKPLPVHPYFLGCWLGDGTYTKPLITHDLSDLEHINKLESLGYKVTARYPGVNNAAVAAEFRHQGVLEKLRDIGVYGKKHIPADYATSSDSQRLELLAGLIDTDGHVERDTGRVRISTCDPNLADDIYRLVVSLGFKGYVCTADAPGYGKYTSNKTVYQVGLEPDRSIPTAIPRKQIVRIDSAQRRRAIVSVTVSANPEPGHCLTVDRPDGLYVVGKTNLVTHNSLTVCVFWPVWCWLTEPSLQFLFSSYAESLSIRDARKARELIAHHWFQQRWGTTFQIKGDQDAVNRYVNTKNGHRISTSVGGRGTGEGGNILVADDAHKINEVESDLMREMVINWWDSVMGTRGNDPATTRRLIVMHRLHDDDLAGHALAQDLDYEYLCLPARYDPDRMVYSFPDGITPSKYRQENPDAIIPTSLQMANPDVRDPRTEPGELLWPDHFGPKEVADLEKTLGPWMASSMLDQKPVPKGGGVIKEADIQYFEEEVEYLDGVAVTYYVLHVTKTGKRKKVPASLCRLFQTADTAMKTNQENDFTAIGTFAQTPDNELLVVDFFIERVEIPYQLGALITERIKHPGVLYQAVEDKGSGTGLIASAKLAGFPFRELKADADKTRRAAPVATMYQNGMVFHNSRGEWLSRVNQQVTKFPKAKYDDAFDCIAYAGILSTTDELIRQAGSVEDLMLYPTAKDRMLELAERYDRSGIKQIAPHRDTMEVDDVRFRAMYDDPDEGEDFSTAWGI